jgi:TRAP-type C4-dicarboxylate transport system substrate-binding protein
VDGAIIPFEIIPPLQLQDQTQYQIEGAGGMRFGTATFNVSMNKARWDSLPEDIQAIFKEASNRDWWGEVGDIWEGTEAWGINIAVEAGNEHVVLTEEETEAMLAAFAPVVDRWIADMEGQGIDGAALVERARELVAQHSR